ncbi:hypothetical protein A5768_11130 [Mycolicibacterium fortuitum]|nr:hypothetical protein A5768_11130 [Mycolicibacterium fortuitum]
MNFADGGAGWLSDNRRIRRLLISISRIYFRCPIARVTRGTRLLCGTRFRRITGSPVGLDRSGPPASDPVHLTDIHIDSLSEPFGAQK